jgi:hypothetical protein
MLTHEDVERYPYALVPVGEPGAILTADGRRAVRLYRVSGGFPVWWARDVLKRNQMRSATRADLVAYAKKFTPLDVPIVALGSPQVRPFVDEWDIEEYPALLHDGAWGDVAVDYKDYNKNDFRWIEDTVIVLAVSEA